MAEMIDLYTYDRQKTGETAERHSALPAGRYRMVVHVCLFNREGQMLIQQRAIAHDRWSGLWDVSMGGGVQQGDDSRSASRRELFEELGLRMDFSEAVPALTIHAGQVIDDVYLLDGEPKLSDLRLQAEEVQDARWADRAEIHRMIDEGCFIPYKHELIDLFFAQREDRSSWMKGRAT